MDYDWCFEHYVNQSMSHQEMADLANCKFRTLKKWCVEKYGLNNRTFRKYKHPTELQLKVMMFGTLGDGHICSRENEPMYIESHSIDEKDYLFWKYEILKDLCKHSPTYYKGMISTFSKDIPVQGKPFYKFNTRILDDLAKIRSMTRSEKINELDELGLSLHMLDDACRMWQWQVSLSEWTDKEKQLYINICNDRFGLVGVLKGDYYNLNAISSKKIDDIILRNIPNDLDIVKKKILLNSHIKKLSNYKYVIVDGDKISLTNYCKKHKTNNVEVRALLDFHNYSVIDEGELIRLMYEKIQ